MGDEAEKLSKRIEDVFTLLKCVSEQNSEIKNEISLLRRQIAVQDKEIEGVKTQNSVLRQENNRLAATVHRLEKKTRENNIVLYRIQEPEDGNTASLAQLVMKFLRETLSIDLQPWDISNVYRIGKHTGGSVRPILVKLTTYLRKREILSKARNLKGTEYGIAEDLTREERNRKKVLYGHYRAALSKGYPASLLRDKVIINGQHYTYEDLGEDELLLQDSRTQVHPGRKSVSAPSTPVQESNCFSFPTAKAEDVGAKVPDKGSEPPETRSRTNSKSSTSSVERLAGKKSTRPAKKH